MMKKINIKVMEALPYFQRILGLDRDQPGCNSARVMEKDSIHHHNLRELLKFAVEQYSKFANCRPDEAVAAAQEILAGMVMPLHMPPQRLWGFDSIYDTPAKARCRFEEMSMLTKRPSPSQNELQASHLPTASLFSPELKTLTDLKKFRKDTRSIFEALEDKANGGSYIAANKYEAKVIRAHTVIASNLHRFTQGQKKDHQKRIQEIIKGVNNPPKELPTLSEMRCLDELRKTHPSFDYYTSTIFKGRLSGSPDAVLFQDGIVVAVAEFKDVTATAKGKHGPQKSKGTLQAAAYSTFFPQSQAFICLDFGSHVTVDPVITGKYISKVTDNVKNYTYFCAEHIN